MNKTDLYFTAYFYIADFASKYAKLIPKDLLMLNCLFGQILHIKQFNERLFDEDIRIIDGNIHIDGLDEIHKEMSKRVKENGLFFLDEQDYEHFMNDSEYNRIIKEKFYSYNIEEYELDLKANLALIEDVLNKLDMKGYKILCIK